jgi:tripartite-type tricarboxylate transporter receptor subunit TctC
MLSGAIQASFDPLAFVLSFLQNGSLRGLAVAADEPINTPVQIPSAISEGIDYRYATWYGILAPAKTPKTVLKVIGDAIVKVSEDPDLQQKIRAQGILPENITLDAFDFTSITMSSVSNL